MVLYMQRGLPRRPMLKVLGLLALMSAACVLLAVIFDKVPPSSEPEKIGPGFAAFLVWFGTFASASGLAIIVAAIKHGITRPSAYPGLVTGSVFVAFFAVTLFTG